MDKAAFRDLLRKYSEGTASRAERKKLEDMILRKPMVGDWEWNSDEERKLMGIRIKQGIDDLRLGTKLKARWKYRLMGVAASIILIVGLVLFWPKLVKDEINNKRLVINESVTNQKEITLTLSNGTSLNLESLDTGVIQETEDFSILKKEAGQMVYETNQGGAVEVGREIKYNVIHVPNGKQFQLKLADGTRVWLNAASTLTYPVHFGMNERHVTLEGEAYFEVAHDHSKPFRITADHTQIRVTGTHFNVTAYASDKTVTTTLLEGGVNVNKDGKAISLRPGYKAVTHADQQSIVKQKANIEQTLAWKNGYFVFEEMDIVSIMKNVARWYDIQVVVEGVIPKKRFGGTFPRDATLDELLADLSMLGNFTFERKGKEVVIMR
ncbi:FecR family protein [Olivibacter domesticus]|uniref:FecR family protein n=1 Tax=Olivibacter domesticus TaxID=407022 RepID=A0A1H7UC04_OLID1|nr:FecR domain-containing protein [Olivibacter domesticus]SEL94543.1 FecR family protein [Olivibacter domesticus]